MADRKPDCHGRNEIACRPDPQPTHGVDCTRSDDHRCVPTTSTTRPAPTTTTTTTVPAVRVPSSPVPTLLPSVSVPTSAPAQQLAFTGPHSALGWEALAGTVLICVGVLIRRLVHR